jgi:hypothetical protein
MAASKAKPSFPFQILPVELKQIVFKETFEAVNDDIGVSLSPDGTTLICPALDIINALQIVDGEIYREARDYLFKTNFRFNFICNPWPHWLIMRAFRNYVNVGPDAYRTISRIILSRFTIRGLLQPDLRDEGNHYEHDTGHLGVDGFHNFSLESFPYLKACPILRYSDCNRRVLDHQRMVKATLTKSVFYATNMFPTLRELGFSLDIVECLPMNYVGPLSHVLMQVSSENSVQKRRQMKCANMMSLMLQLQTIKITNIDLHIYWDDFVRRHRTYDVEFPSEQQKQTRDIFLHVLRDNVHAKSITNHSDI